MTATYLGTKGTHGMQEFLPNYLSHWSNESMPGLPIGICLPNLERKLDA